MKNGENSLGTNVGSALVATLNGGAQASPAQTNHGQSGHNHNHQPPDRRPTFVPQSHQQRRPDFRGGRYHYEGQRPGGPKPEMLGQVNMTKAEIVLVKFSFFEDTNFDLIPPGIKVQEWVDKKKILGDEYRDQGVQPILARKMSVGMVRRALANDGFRLTQVFMYDKTEHAGGRGNFGRKKFAVTLEFKRVSGDSIQITDKMQEHLRYLANIVWEETFVWDNTRTQELSVTVNCRNPLKGCKSTRALTVRNHEMQVVETETPEEKA